MRNISAVERRNEIIEMLNERGRVNVNELSETFGVSGVAIRIDLTELEKQGLLTRVHGGAVTSYKSYYDMNLAQRSNANAREKKLIATRVNKIINNNDTIFMNAGTTPLFVMREIADKTVTIVTNSIALALEGAKNPNFKIILLGGDVDSNYQFTYGITAIKEIGKYNADILVMSVDGIDPERGTSTFYYHEAELCRKMIENANKTIVAADYSKIGRSAFAEIGETGEIDVLVTDGGADEDCLSKLKRKGIEVLIARD